jgi:hypothetical protein
MIDKGLQNVLTLFYFFVKKYKNIAWAPCGHPSHLKVSDRLQMWLQRQYFLLSYFKTLGFGRCITF